MAAAQGGIAVSGIEGTGKGGRIMSKDVKKALKARDSEAE